MFKAYRIYHLAGGRVLVGHPYGDSVLDAHEYPTTDDAVAMYQAFLQDKIQEGFMPRSELKKPLPKKIVAVELDMARLAEAFKRIMGG